MFTKWQYFRLLHMISVFIRSPLGDGFCVFCFYFSSLRFFSLLLFGACAWCVFIEERVHSTINLFNHIDSVDVKHFKSYWIPRHDLGEAEWRRKKHPMWDMCCCVYCLIVCNLALENMSRKKIRWRTKSRRRKMAQAIKKRRYQRNIERKSKMNKHMASAKWQQHK